MTTNILKLIEEFWTLIVAIAGGIGGYITWSKKQKQSTMMLYDELEKLKQKVVIQVSREVQQANLIAEKEEILNKLRLNCPECYEKIIFKNGGNKTN